MSSRDPFEASLLKALGHPLRLRIVEALTETGESSPIAVARELGQPLSTVSHHFRMLRDLGWIELVRTEPRRGAVEHFYRAAMRPFIDDEEWVRLPLTMRRGLARQTFRRVFSEASLAGSAGGFDDAGAHIDRMPLELDETGRREVSEVLTEVLQRLHAIQQRVDTRRRRPAADVGTVVETCVALLHFRLASEPAEGVGGTRGPASRRRPGFRPLRSGS
jgi:DNA-binding transcriptional ArsR family regulator